MSNLFFPTVMVDNFSGMADELVRLSKSDKVEWANKSEGRWPGLRSQFLNEVDKDVFEFVMQKYLAIHFSPDEQHELSWHSEMYFQRISNDYTSGWIHNDFPHLHTIILYLTPDANPSSGTSIYLPDEDWPGTRYNEFKVKHYRGEISNEEAEGYRLNANRYFKETMFVGNAYDRLIGFDSHYWHGVKDFGTGKEERLTLLAFLSNLRSPVTHLQHNQRMPFMRPNPQ